MLIELSRLRQRHELVRRPGYDEEPENMSEEHTSCGTLPRYGRKQGLLAACGEVFDSLTMLWGSSPQTDWAQGCWWVLHWGNNANDSGPTELANVQKMRRE